MMLPSIANNLLSDAVNNILQEKKNCHAAKVELKREIRRVRQERKRAMISHKKSIKLQCQHLESLRERIKTTRSEELPMYRYASELKDSETPTHILLLQAQVCRAVHHLCVDTAQLQMLERSKEAFVLLAQGQEGEQLNRVLWAIEAKVELQQQHSSEDDFESAPARPLNENEESHSKEKSLLVTANFVDSLLGVNEEDVIETSVETLQREQPTEVNNTRKSLEDHEDAITKSSVGQHDDLPRESRETVIHSNHFSSEKIHAQLEGYDEVLNGTLKDSSNGKVDLFDNLSAWESPNSNGDEAWQEITVKDLKKSNLDTLLDDANDTQESFHISLPTIRQSHVAMNRRGSMLAERCYSENMDTNRS